MKNSNAKDVKDTTSHKEDAIAYQDTSRTEVTTTLHPLFSAFFSSNRIPVEDNTVDPINSQDSNIESQVNTMDPNIEAKDTSRTELVTLHPLFSAFFI